MSVDAGGGNSNHGQRPSKSKQTSTLIFDKIEENVRVNW